MRNQVLQNNASRFVPAAGIILLFVASGCEHKGVQNGVGTAMIGAGNVVVLIPHPAAKVVGACLIAGGTALVVEVQINGETREETMQLTPEQQDRIREGASVEVKDGQGATKTLRRSTKGKVDGPDGPAAIDTTLLLP